MKERKKKKVKRNLDANEKMKTKSFTNRNDA